MKHILIILLFLPLFFSCSSDDDNNPFVGTWELLDVDPVIRYMFNEENKFTRCIVMSSTQVSCGKLVGYQYTKDTFTANLTGEEDTYKYEILMGESKKLVLTLKSTKDPSIVLEMVKK